MQSVDRQQLVELVTLCRESLYSFAEAALVILDKQGRAVPFKLNRAQVELHERLEKQRRETGKVRALILKGRQQGISTYLQARLRWRLQFSMGQKAYVVAHEQAASSNLFKMARRYHDSMLEVLKPSTGASNTKELWFDELDCRYEVATAGTKEIGRSGTAQYMHASEYAFWPSAEDHWAGIGQVVPDMPGTEVYVETTANGVANDFYARWKQAINGVGDYEAIFLPWFWQPEYRRPVPKDWARTPEEDELAELYRLDDEQLAFRRAKIETDFAGDATRFQQEYPCNWREAFVKEARDTFIPASSVLRAQGTKLVQNYGPMVVGVDPARFGDDATALVVRQGRRVRAMRQWRGKSTMEVAGLCARFIENTPSMRMMFVDVIGIGAGVFDRLVELGYADKVKAVNAAEKAAESEKYVNKRAECWAAMKEWLANGPVELPEGDEWMADLTAPGFTYDSNGRLKLERKEDIKRREGKSPDIGDALSLTFAEPVRELPDVGAPLMPPMPVYDDVAGY